MTSRPEHDAVEMPTVKYAESLGWLCWKFQIIGKRGAPDRLMVTPYGLVIFVEFKNGDEGELSESQKKRLNELMERGAEFAVIKDEAAGMAFVNQFTTAEGYAAFVAQRYQAEQEAIDNARPRIHVPAHVSKTRH